MKVETKETDSVHDSNKNDDHKTLRFELNEKKQIIATMQAEYKQQTLKIDELKKQIEAKAKSLSESQRAESSLNQKLAENTEKLNSLNRKLEESEQVYRKLKLDFDNKLKSEIDLKTENQRINTKFSDLSNQLKEKLSEIEFLNRENNTLQERVNLDEAKIKTQDEQIQKLKFRIDDLNFDIDVKNNEMAKIESLILSKETELGDFNKKLTNRELQIKWKLEEFERNRKELDVLRVNYADLNTKMNDKVNGLTKEIEALAKEKDQLNAELSELKTEHEKCMSKRFIFYSSIFNSKIINFGSFFSYYRSQD